MAFFPFTNGQKPMSSSIGVVIASDQTPVSVVGQLGASIIGIVPVIQSGTVVTSIVGIPSISGTVGASVFGTVTIGDGVDIVDIAAFPSTDGAALGNQVKVTNFPLLFNGSNWDRWRGNSSIGGLVNTGQGSVITLIQGSIAAVQSGISATSVVGTIGASVIGTVPVTQSGTMISSIVGGYAEDSPHTSGDPGVFVLAVRNDTLASVASADLDYTLHAVGPAGETIVANAPLTKWVQGVASTFTGVIQPLIAAQGSSVFTYITGVQIANASPNNVYLTFYGATSSVVGYTVAPANGGSNIVLPNAWKTNANGAFSASVSGVASVFLSAEGFISKT